MNSNSNIRSHSLFFYILFKIVKMNFLKWTTWEKKKFIYNKLYTGDEGQRYEKAKFPREAWDVSEVLH